MLSMLALLVVLLTGFYLVGLAALAISALAKATRFLSAFATTALAHYLELAVRLAVGWSFMMHAPHMMFAPAFSFFGWALVITTAGLLVVPWRWHQRFARYVVPHATRQLGLVAAVSLAGGCVVLAAAIRGNSV